MRPKFIRSYWLRKLTLERMEARLNLATVAWDGGGDGRSWEDVRNWQSDQLPGPGDEVVIDVPWAPDVHVRSHVTVDKLTTNGSLTVNPLASSGAASVFAVASTLHAAKGLHLSYSELAQATVSAGTHVEVISSVLRNTTIQGSAKVVQDSEVVDGLTLNGSLTLAGSLRIQQTQDIVGSGQILFVSPNFSPVSLFIDDGAVLTLGSQIRIDSEYGAIEGGKLINRGHITGLSLALLTKQLENFGTIQARQGTITIDVPNWSGPYGTLQADAGTLQLQGTYHTPDQLTLANEGQVFLLGTVDNRGRSLSATGTGKVLLDGRLVGGTVPAGQTVQALNSAELVDVVINGRMLVDTKQLTVLNSLTVGGIIEARSGLIYFPESTTINGTGTIDLGYRINSFSRLEIGLDAVLTLGAGLQVTGNYGRIAGGKLINRAMIVGSDLTVEPGQLENFGSITASQGQVTIAVDNWQGPFGTLAADAGNLYFGRTYRTPDQLTLANEGQIVLFGTIDNRGRSLNVVGAGTVLLDGRFIGGTVPAGQTLQVLHSAELEDVVLNGRMLVDTNQLTVINSLTLGGTIEARSGLIYFPESATINGTGTIDLGYRINSFSRLEIEPDATLTLGTGLQVISDYGRIAGGKLINRATIVGSTLTIEPSQLENFGSITANQGQVTIDVDNWQGPYGTLVADAGQLYLQGAFRTPDLLTLANEGTVFLSGTIDNRGRSLSSTGSGQVALAGRLIGGTVPNGQTIEATYFAEIEDVVVNGRMIVDTNSLSIINHLMLNGIMEARSGVIYSPESATINGTGTIDLGYRINSFSRIEIGPTATLTLGAGLKVTSNYGRIVSGKLINHATIVGSSLTIEPSQLENFGSITATQGQVTVAVDNWRGPFGTLVADAGLLYLQATYRTPDLLTLANDGTIFLSGTLDNRGRSLTATGQGQVVVTGRLIGGSIPADQTIYAGNFCELEAVTINGRFVADDHTITVLNRLVVNGSLELYDGSMYSPDALTMSGVGQVLLARRSVRQSRIQSPSTVTIAPSLTVMAEEGFIETGTLINQGTIVSTGTLGLSSLVTRNQGTILADGGQVGLLNFWENQGTLETRARKQNEFELLGSMANLGESLNLHQGTLTGGTWRIGAQTVMQMFETEVLVNAASLELHAEASLLTTAADPALANLRRNAVEGTLQIEPGAVLQLSGDFTNLGKLSFPVGSQAGRLSIAGKLTFDGTLVAPARDEFVAKPNDRFPVLEFASSEGNFREVQSRFFTYEVDPTLGTLISKRAAADLATTALTVSNINWSVDQNISLSYQVTNASTQSVSESWTDGIYLSTDQKLDAGDRLIGQASFAGQLDPQQHYERTWSGHVPGVLPGTYFVLVAADIRARLSDPVRANNSLSSSTSVNVSMAEMSVGSERTLNLAPYASAHLQLTTSQLADFTLRLQRLAGTSEIEIVTRQAELPLADQFDQRVTMTGDARLPFSPTGSDSIQYVLIRNTGSSSAQLRLTSAYVGLEVSSFAPASAANVGSVTLEIRGHGLEFVNQVTLVGSNRTLTAASKSVFDDKLMWATFDLRGASLGSYQLRLQSLDGTALAESSFAITTGEPGRVRANLVVPSAVRAGRPFDVTIELANEGATEVEAPIFLLKAAGAVFVSDQQSPPSSSELIYGFSPTGNADRLQPGYRGSITVRATANAETNFELLQLDRTQPFPWDAFSNLQHNFISAATWQAAVADFRARLPVAPNATLGETVEAMFGPKPDSNSSSGAAGEALHTAISMLVATSLLKSAIVNHIKMGNEAPGALAQDKSMLWPGSPDWTNHADEIANYCPEEPLNQLTSAEIEELKKLTIPRREDLANDPKLSDSVRSPSLIKYEIRPGVNGQNPVAVKLEKPEKYEYRTYLREISNGSPANPNAETIVLVHGWKGTTSDDRVETLGKTIKAARANNVRVLIYDWSEGAVDEGPFDPANRIPGAAASLNKLLKQANVQPGKTSLIGESYGSYVISQASAALPNQYRQVIGFNPANQIPAWGSNQNFNITYGKDNKVFITVSGADHAGASLTATYNGLTIDLRTPADGSWDLLAHRNVATHTFGLTWATNRFRAGDTDWLDKSSSDWLGKQPDHVGDLADATIACSKPEALEPYDYEHEWSGGFEFESELRATRIDQASTQVARSYDPNEKLGTEGFGEPGFRRADEGLSYRINFENDPKLASAPALDVIITDVLTEKLDLTSLELGSFGFGSLIIDVPAGLQSFSREVSTLNMDGTPLLVRISAGLDVPSRTLRWQFTSIDPLSGQSPDSIYAGFLPVNDTTRRGEGFVTFRIQPTSNLPSGAVIENQASIVFDDNAAIITNTTVHTLDGDVPTSEFQSLPIYTTSYDFTVQWAGTDSGSGVGSYDVYVSRDGAAFTPWLTGTQLTSATFTGIEGSQYQFAVLSTDNVGQRQLSQTLSTVTRVTRFPWHNSTSPLDVNRNGSVTALDALLLINLLNQRFGPALQTPTTVPASLIDVSGDNFLTALDALLVINALNSRSSGAESESEPDVVAADARAHDAFFDELLPDRRRRGWLG